MAESRPSAQATSEPDRFEPDERGNESPSKPVHAELCKNCRAVALNEPDLDRGIGYNRIQHRRKDSIPNFPSITAAAEAGCHLCKMLLSNKTIQRITNRYSESPAEIPITIDFSYDCQEAPFGVLSLMVFIAIDTEPIYRPWIERFRIEADPDKPCAQMLGIRTNTFLPNWSFDEKLTIMRNWIGNCKSSCQAERLDRKLPTRLLDLSSSQSPNQDVRLIHSKDISTSSDCKYAALSHCWGSPDRPPLKTDMDSLDEMLCNIPFASLPANYRDAVRVARGLGIDYLWIDSLCIVQDSLEDWEAEASRMVDVYQQAYVTIVAATGYSCHDGFLDPKVDKRVKMPYVSSLAGVPIKDTYYVREDYHGAWEIENSPWNQRGWTLQESTFSSRRLFFTQNSFSYIDENHLHMMDGTRTGFRGILSAKFLLKDTQTWGYSGWSSLIENYSRRHFTFHRDRLPAISAWAQLMSRTMNDRYLAGVWEGDLLRGLLWRCKEVSFTQTLAKRLQSTLKEHFLAPSWSWASQTQSVLYEWVPQNRRHRLVEVEISPIGANPFGRFKNGHLVIFGAVCPLPIAHIERCEDFFQSTMDDVGIIRYYMDWWEKSMDVVSGQKIERGIVQDVKMLLLADCGHTHPLLSYEAFACGLLLLPTGADEEYWRVGMFSIHCRWGRVDRIISDCEWSTIKIV